MLFDKSPFESYKERNLYYKFFAGYFFNGLVPGAGNGLSVLSIDWYRHGLARRGQD